jgi:hypothetical protein
MSDNPYEASPIAQQRRTNKWLYLSLVLAFTLLLITGAGTFFYVKLDQARRMEQKALEQAERARKLMERATSEEAKPPTRGPE